MANNLDYQNEAKGEVRYATFHRKFIASIMDLFMALMLVSGVTFLLNYTNGLFNLSADIQQAMMQAQLDAPLMASPSQQQGDSGLQQNHLQLSQSSCASCKDKPSVDIAKVERNKLDNKDHNGFSFAVALEIIKNFFVNLKEQNILFLYLLFTFFIPIAVVIVYFLAFWIICQGQTPGGLIVGCKIRHYQTLERPKLSAYVLRILGCIVMILPFCLGILVMLCNRKGRGIHDFMASTVVIVDRGGVR